MAQSWKDMWLVADSPRKQPVSAGRRDGREGGGLVCKRRCPWKLILGCISMQNCPAKSSHCISNVSPRESEVGEEVMCGGRAGLIQRGKWLPSRGRRNERMAERFIRDGAGCQPELWYRVVYRERERESLTSLTQQIFALRLLSAVWTHHII